MTAYSGIMFTLILDRQHLAEVGSNKVELVGFWARIS